MAGYRIEGIFNTKDWSTLCFLKLFSFRRAKLLIFLTSLIPLLLVPYFSVMSSNFEYSNIQLLNIAIVSYRLKFINKKSVERSIIVGAWLFTRNIKFKCFLTRKNWRLKYKWFDVISLCLYIITLLYVLIDLWHSVLKCFNLDRD